MGGGRRSGHRPATVRASASALISVLAVSVAVLGGAATVVDAHATALALSPAPGSTVGGPLDTVELVFDQEVVVLHGFQVETRDGMVLPGEVVRPTSSVLRYELDDPITTDGIYIARYTITSSDGDTTPSGYAFTFDASADPPESIDPTLYGAAGGRSWLWPTILACIVLVNVVLAVMLGTRHRKLRLRRADSASELAVHVWLSIGQRSATD